jgi:hypothetical protein
LNLQKLSEQNHHVKPNHNLKNSLSKRNLKLKKKPEGHKMDDWKEIRRLADKSRKREKKDKESGELKNFIKSFLWSFRFFGKP